MAIQSNRLRHWSRVKLLLRAVKRTPYSVGLLEFHRNSTTTIEYEHDLSLEHSSGRYFWLGHSAGAVEAGRAILVSVRDAP